METFDAGEPLKVGERLWIGNTRSVATLVTIEGKVSGTRFEVTLAPGQRCAVVGGREQVTITFKESNEPFAGPGLSIVKDAVDGSA